MIAVMRRLRWTRLLTALLAWGLIAIAVTAPAQTPAAPAAALVLEVSGGRIPGVEPFREIPAGTTVAVPAGVRFAFQHYASCRRFLVTGGVVTFRADGVEFSGGARPSDTRAACPRKVALKADGASAAVVMRSLGPPRVAIPSRPDFLLVGPRASEFSGLRVRRGKEVVLERTLAAGQPLAWPPDAAPLAPATNYELELLPTASGREPVSIGVRTLEASAAEPALTLVSAE